MYRVRPAQTVEINEGGICRMVNNGGTTDISVPTRSPTEWASGANAFLNNLASMDRVSVAACGDWWENLPKPGVAEFGMAHNTWYTWKDQDQEMIVAGGWNINRATYYNADTGECAPAKTYIGRGPLFYEYDRTVYMFYIQLCESDLRATPPFIGLKDQRGRVLPDQPVASYGTRP
jgi:hypothetical protein